LHDSTKYITETPVSLFLVNTMHSTIHTEAKAHEGFRNYARKNNYLEMIVPSITLATGACENVNTIFEVAFEGKSDWNERKPRLAQTGQLFLETRVADYGNVFCIGKSFRAEMMADDRHLMEFTLAEIEIPSNLDGLLKEMEGFVRSMAKCAGRSYLLDSHAFERVKYQEGVEYLDLPWGTDLGAQDEKKIVHDLGHGHPTFITHFPVPSTEYEVEKFFNMKRDGDEVLSADLLLPGVGESAGAAEREHDYSKVLQSLEASQMFHRIVELGGGLDDFKWYLDHLKEKGNVPHSGCGFGMGRIIQWLLSSDRIQDSTGFPVWYGNVS